MATTTYEALAGVPGVAADGWTLRYDGFDPEREGLREALCALGNGYLVTRGAAPESVADGTHYPGTYLAGVYDRAVSHVAGRSVENEDLVNAGNWLPLTFRADDGPWFTGSPDELLDHHTVLEFRHGILVRRARVRDAAGRVTAVTQRRLVHMEHPHLAVLETTLVPENWSGTLTVRSALDGSVRNSGVARYRGLADRHLAIRRRHVARADTVVLESETLESRIRIAMAARTRVARGGPEEDRRGWTERQRVGQDLTIAARRGQEVTVEKTVSVHTGRDAAIGDPVAASVDEAARAPDFDALLDAHAERWTDLWSQCRLDLGCGVDADRSARLYAFHILQTLTAHTADLDAGVPARGLHGEAYRGHVFWDELFVLPYLNPRLPEVSRALMRYRYRRLDAARRAAEAEGFRGALFPWQSGGDGREETPRLHHNPRSGRWLPDHSHLQRHVGAAVAYNAWQYFQATADVGYLAAEGAELLVEIARFWASAAAYDPALRRYRIRGVMGPDEYHDGYPWSDRPGLDDNAYTNVMASWVLRTAGRALDLLPSDRREELAARLGLHADEPARWDHVSRNLRICFHDGVISQFHRYGELAELDWEAYRRRYGDIRRLDRILEAEGDTPNRYQVSKQADVLMLNYLFPPDELTGLFTHLGYHVDADTFDRTARYYMRRTAHGSTLSAVVHAWVLARADRAASGGFLREALAADIHDVQGGTTAEGIHLGAMASCLDLLTRGYTGLATRENALVLDPALPDGLGPLDFRLRYRGHWGIHVHISHTTAAVSLPAGEASPIRVRVRDTEQTVEAGGTLRVRLPGPGPGRPGRQTS
ncbi:glycoside hydrolase family 65 protein [Yinghuangia sp. ASG 101]|uniref:glycoside hydrolase family 65 protein n=1 Tax=Yinghuangia sp. ASG 101 TaxID=2896848 RepID=UPI001E5103A4|nr:glycosyl hydrolase family 65 protein [Yinghuangia sp. ASG 101]UGQ11694.1 glycoside hydrolase family 65 protein [Yinghuangia sp. ASG 101]